VFGIIIIIVVVAVALVVVVVVVVVEVVVMVVIVVVAVVVVGLTVNLSPKRMFAAQVVRQLRKLPWVNRSLTLNPSG